jgi:hypothetical protein
MYITADNGRFTAQASGQQKTALLAEKENYFFSEEAGGFLEFSKDDKGIFNELIIHQQGQNISAKRIYPKWGLTGTATSKGWEENISDIEFREDTLKKGLWVIYNLKLNTGELKFRFNNDWSINDKLLDRDGENIKIDAGTYNIILDLTDEANPKYSIRQSR